VKSKAPTFNKRSWLELRRYWRTVAAVQSRLMHREPPPNDDALYAAISLRCVQTGKNAHQVVAILVREMRATKRATVDDDVAPGRCPYCRGIYSITQSCYGPRTENPDENTCASMARHRRLVNFAAEADDRGLA
jgi:hypothetical protein